jgi:hypothetical protein
MTFNAPTRAREAGGHHASAANERLGTSCVDRPHVLPREAAHVLDCTEDSIRSLLRTGHLIDCSPDRWVRIDVGSLESLMHEEVISGRLSPAASPILEDIVQGRLLIPKKALRAQRLPADRGLEAS